MYSIDGNQDFEKKKYLIKKDNGDDTNDNGDDNDALLKVVVMMFINMLKGTPTLRSSFLLS